MRSAKASSAPSSGDEPAEQQAQAVAHDDQVGVVGDERAGGAEVNERPGRRRLVAEGVHVRHDVVAEPPLVRAPPRRGRRRRGAPASAASASSGIARPSSRSASASASQSRRQSPMRCGSPQSALHRGRGVARAQRRRSSVVGHRNTRSVKVICPSALEVDPERPRRAGDARGRSPTCSAAASPRVRLIARITSPSRSPVAAAHLRRDLEDQRALLAPDAALGLDRGRHRDELEVLRARCTFSAVTVGRSPVTMRRAPVARPDPHSTRSTASPTWRSSFTASQSR